MLKHGDFCDIIIKERDKRNRGINSYLLFCTERGYIHMRQKLSKHNLLLVGFTLFSMFFGAGNLIFPPFLGAQAGSLTWQAMGGFLISAVGLPVMGVAAVALSGGLTNLAGRVHPWFCLLYTSRRRGTSSALTRPLQWGPVHLSLPAGPTMTSLYW